MNFDHKQAEYAETIAVTFIKAMDDRELGIQIKMSAAALSLLKVCRADDMKPNRFKMICMQLAEAYNESILDD